MVSGDFELFVLGPLEGRGGGRALDLPARKQRTLLAALLLRRGEDVSSDQLVEDLWPGGAPPSARNALQVYVSQLRKVLPAGALVSGAAGYRLAVDADRVDVFRFERLVSDARARSDPRRVRALLIQALELWRGPALADFTYEPFAQADIARLEELRHEALELRIDADLVLGQLGLVAELEALTAVNPLRERLRAQLMLALYRAGRQAEALAAYRDVRTTLVEQLGVEPGPELRALQAAILRQDVSLALPPRPRGSAQRKLVTVLVADLAGAFALAPAELRSVLRRYYDAAAAAVARHGGSVDKFIADTAIVAFGLPLAHQDDALRATRAAVEIRDAVAAIANEANDDHVSRVSVRIGIATAEVFTEGAASDAPATAAPAAAIAARLEETTEPGEIAVDALTHELTTHTASYDELDPVALEGTPETLHRFRLVDLHGAVASALRRTEAPLIGRRAEFAALTAAAIEASRDRSLRTAVLIGPAGIGKSRLAHDLVATARTHWNIAACHCAPDGMPFPRAPLQELITSRGDPRAALADEPDSDSVADALKAAAGAAAASQPDQLRWAFHRYCESLTRSRPLLILVDDAHWADTALGQVLDYLPTNGRTLPILLLITCDQEATADAPEVAATAEPVTVEPLSDQEAGDLIDHLLAATPLGHQLRGRAIAVAQGNPLFLEQLAAHAAETGAASAPPSLRALLAARFDQLGPGERAVLERAAVFGREFAINDVKMLLDPDAAATTRTHLESLAARRFLRPLGSTRFRFEHDLVHNTIQTATPRQLRAELHKRAAETLTQRARPAEFIAHHLRRAALLQDERPTPPRGAGARNHVPERQI